MGSRSWRAAPFALSLDAPQPHLFADRPGRRVGEPIDGREDVPLLGGEVLIVNHFSQTEGVRGWVERRMAPFAEVIGWRPVFDQSRVMVCDNLTLSERRALRPWGIFTMMRFKKSIEEGQRPIAAE